jgi:hypothetical protein
MLSTLQAAQHANSEDAADVFAADRRLHRLDDDQECAGQRGSRNRDRECDPLDADRIGRHELQSKLILRHRHDRAPSEGA